jgi:SAM-dependent methyltransferase
MYDDIFRQVPDHRRLIRKEDLNLISKLNETKLGIVKRYLKSSTVFAEFAPGDCTFSIKISKHVGHVYGMDISNQWGETDCTSGNFELIIYDGYNLDRIHDNSIDIVFSDQLIEHLHPDDTVLHFKLVHRILKDGGKYIFNTPHSFSGPHDVSRYFSDESKGLHLKEWTYSELKDLFMALQFSRLHTYWYGRGIKIPMPYSYFSILEKIFILFPRRYSRFFGKYLVPTILCMAQK